MFGPIPKQVPDGYIGDFQIEIPSVIGNTQPHPETLTVEDKNFFDFSHFKAR